MCPKVSLPQLDPRNHYLQERAAKCCISGVCCFAPGPEGRTVAAAGAGFCFFYLCNPRLIDVASQYIVVEIRKLFYNLTFFQSTRLSLKIKINQWGPCRVGTVVALLDPIQRVAGSSPSKSKTCFVVSTHCKQNHCVVRWKKSENLIYIP